jgi:hypothetical protein
MKGVNSTGEKAEFDGVGRPQPRVVVFGHFRLGELLCAEGLGLWMSPSKIL